MNAVHTITLSGQVYNLPPFSAGQMRRQVDPLLDETQELMVRAQALKTATEVSPDEALDLTRRQRQAARAQADLVLRALQNQYPHLTLDEVETLTPAHLSQVFNEILMLTVSGSNEPGELLPPPAAKKRR